MAPPEIPATSRRWQYTQTSGGIEKHMELKEITTPTTASAKQHLVQMIAVALNPVDYKPAEVPLLRRLLISYPATPGIDFAGRILVPATGSPLQAGQLVFGAASAKPFAAGGLAEVALTDVSTTAALPDGVAPADAATLTVAGLTAYQSIVPHVKKGDKIFINGGSGGTGSFGIQIAKAKGCHVTTTCSTPNVDLCKKLGADEVIDYRTQDVVEALIASGHKFNHVVDNAAADVNFYWRCHEYTDPKALYIMVAGPMSLRFVWDTIKMRFLPAMLGGGKRKTMGFFPEAKQEDLLAIVELMKEGKVQPLIDTRFPFEQAVAAFQKLKTGRAKGKVVVDVRPET